MSTTTTDDRDLAVRFRNGDPDAIREVYRRFSGSLFTLSRSMLADAEDAHDAVQQAFLQAWRAASQYDPERPLSAWLYQICRRVCIDSYRRSVRAADVVAAVRQEAEVVTTGSTMEQTWTVWEVRRAIDELPPHEREIVRLADLEGPSLPEIAAHLGIPVGTVKSRSFRAHRHLADLLAHLRPAVTDERVAR
jgi:RNA polymerase sigma-70 factor, ECF subfamily